MQNPKVSKCAHKRIESNMVPNTCRDCGIQFWKEAPSFEPQVKCECEPAVFEGVITSEYCSIHQPDLRAEPLQPEEGWEGRFENQKGGFTTYNTQSGSRFLNEEQLKYFIRQEIHAGGQAMLDTVEKELATIKRWVAGIRINSEVNDEYVVRDIDLKEKLADLHTKLYSLKGK